MPESKRVPEQIIDIMNEKGPSLPIQLAKKIGISSLFICAYLSELAEEKRIKVSHLRVGGSPLYFLEGQEKQLEKFHTFMHPKEIEAFSLLKENKVLRDLEQEPAIRVALRSIRDFAVGFKVNDEIFWRYFSASNDEINNFFLSEKRPLKKQEIRKPATKPQEILEIKKPRIIEIKGSESERPAPERIKIEEIQEKPREIKRKPRNDDFLEEVKSYLKNKSMELVSIEDYNKKEVIARVRFNLTPEKVHLLFAYNKKRISDKELLKAHKVSLKHELDYLVLFKGEFSKKLKDTIEAYKSLVSAEKI